MTKKKIFIAMLFVLFLFSFSAVSAQDNLFLRADSLKTGDSVRHVRLDAIYDRAEIIFKGGESGDSIIVSDQWWGNTDITPAKVFNLNTNELVDTVFIPQNAVVRVKVPWEVVLGINLRRSAPTVIPNRRTDFRIRAKRLF